MRPRTIFALGSLFALGLLVSACGGAAEVKSADYPKTREGAAAELDDAEQRLYAAFGRAPTSGAYGQVAPTQQGYPQGAPQPAYAQPPGVVAGAPPPPPPPVTPTPPPQPAPAADAPAKYAEPGSTTHEDPCTVACRALASMTNAAERLCGLAGEADARCSGARSRVRSATDLVHKSCPSCG